MFDDSPAALRQGDVMDLVLGYLAGLLTLINPCVLPVLPIVLATAVQAHKLGPVAVAAGMSLSFVALGMFVTVAGYALGLDETMIANGGAVLMIGFGLVLLCRAFRPGLPRQRRACRPRLMASWIRLIDLACGGSSLVGCCWARYGAHASGPRWAGQSLWPRRAKAFCLRVQSWPVFRWVCPPSFWRWAMGLVLPLCAARR